MKQLSMSIFVLFTISSLVNATNFTIDKTFHKVPKKALIVKHDAILYDNWYSNSGKEAPFMELFFIMHPEKNNRIPVIKYLEHNQPDGWLEKSSFKEWNTNQMINFRSQIGRKRTKVFKKIPCAQTFSSGLSIANDCEILGEEPVSQSTSKEYNLFVPLISKKNQLYYASFVRVNQKDTNQSQYNRNFRRGYNLVFVIDSTKSMTRYFSPTKEVLKVFIRYVKTSIQHEVAPPLKIGLVFYRDRTQKKLCDIKYITKYQTPLTDNISEVLHSLSSEKTTACDSEDDPEAVFDGLYRAITETGWDNNSFKTIILVGDAPPNTIENPMGHTVRSILNAAKDKRIRFLTFKIGKNDYQEFEDFALKTIPGCKGYFRMINRVGHDNVGQYKKQLRKALTEEWKLLLQVMNTNTPINQDDPNYPVIVYNFPELMNGEQKIDLVTGWTPQTIENKKIFDEFIFLNKYEFKNVINFFEALTVFYQLGIKSGVEGFLDAIRESVAKQLGIDKKYVFHGDETLSEVLFKTNILPFKTTILNVSPNELISGNKKIVFEQQYKIIEEKVKQLREHQKNTTHRHYFGDVCYYYVPRNLFP